MDSRKIEDTMNYSEAILGFVKACGGIKQLSRTAWQHANQKAWSQFQSEIFTWILMMVVRNQIHNDFTCFSKSYIHKTQN